MSDTAQRLKQELGQLTFAQREEMIRYLLDLQDAAPEEEADAAFEAELDRRFEEFQSGKDPGISLAELKARMRAKYETEAAFDAALERRTEEMLSGKDVCVPADEVFARLRQKYS